MTGKSMCSFVNQSRRDFLRQSVLAASLVGSMDLFNAGVALAKDSSNPKESVPWYRRCLRWGQTNITELDVTRYDIAWWRDYWKRTCVQGIIVNAGGIVAYYPTEYP